MRRIPGGKPQRTITQSRAHPLRATLTLVRLILLLLLLGLLVDAALAQATVLRRSPRPFVDPANPVNIMVDNTGLPALGITVELEQYATSRERRAALQRLRKADFGWVRQRFDWAEIEPQPGRFDWAKSDAILQDINASGLIPLVVLDGSPRWARAERDADNSLAPPAHPQDFARFAAAFAARYQHNVQFYQLWDEPNISPHWGNRRPDPIAYAQLLSLASPAVRAADPNVNGATVVALAALAPTADRGHLALDEPYFLQRLYAAGAAPYFDAVAAQPFGFGTAPDDPRLHPQVLNLRRVDLLRRAMVQAGDESTPMWAVRYGWSRLPATAQHGAPFRSVTPANQQAFALDALDFAAKRSWLTAMGWAVDQPNAAPTDPRRGLALTDALHEHFASRLLPAAALPNASTFASGDLLRLLVFSVLLGTVLSRTIVIAARLPWRRLRDIYLATPPWARAMGWLALFIVYHLATWPPLVVLCWVVATLAFAAQPVVGLALAAAALPFHFWHKELVLPGFTVAVAPSHAALGCLLAALAGRTNLPDTLKLPGRFTMLLSKVRVHSRSSTIQLSRNLSALDWLALAWLILALLSARNAWHAAAYREALLDFTLVPLCLYAATRLLARTPQRQRLLVAALLVGGVGVALVGLWKWSGGDGASVDGVRRLIGPHFSANHTALYLERSLFVGLGLWLTARARERWLFGGAVGLVAAALVLTASRGALLLGVPTGSLLLLFWWYKERRERVGRLWNRVATSRWRGGTALVAGVFASGVMLLPLTTRLLNFATLRERLIIWQATLRLWWDVPLLGAGIGGFAWRYPAYLPIRRLDSPQDTALLHPHNLWLELISNFGAVGLVWLGALLFILRSQTHRARARSDWLAWTLIAALGAGLAHAQVDAFIALEDLAAWLWIALGLLRHGQKESQADQVASTSFTMSTSS